MIWDLPRIRGSNIDPPKSAAVVTRTATKEKDGRTEATAKELSSSEPLTRSPLTSSLGFDTLS